MSALLSPPSVVDDASSEPLAPSVIFTHYCNIVLLLASNLKEGHLLELYGLYKLVMFPDALVEGSDEYIGKRPGFFSIAARRKYDAVVEEGKREGGREERMVMYVKVVEAAAAAAAGVVLREGKKGGVDVNVRLRTGDAETLRLRLLLPYPLPEGEVKEKEFSLEGKPSTMMDNMVDEEGGDGGAYEEGIGDEVLLKRLIDFIRAGDIESVATFPPELFVPKSEVEEDTASVLHEACDLQGDSGAAVVKAVLGKLKEAAKEGDIKKYLEWGEIKPIETAAVAGNVGSVVVLKEEGANIDMEEMEEFEVCEEVMAVLKIN